MDYSKLTKFKSDDVTYPIGERWGVFLSDSQAKDIDVIHHLAGQTLSEPIISITPLLGSMSYNYEINHKLILKLPNENTHLENWHRLSQSAPFLQQYLTFQIPKPNFKPLHLKNTGEVISLSYPKIEGKCFSNELVFSAQERAFKIHFFEQLSDAAAQIHSVPLEKIPFKFPNKIDYLEKCFFKNEKGDNYCPKKLFQRLLHDPYFGYGKSALRTALLAHTDLHPGNVLFNDKNELVAILDFDTMVNGDRFLEFRPNLYTDPLDIHLFQRIYQKRTGAKINMSDIYQQEIARSSLSWFYCLYQTYRSLSVPERDKRMKQAFMQKISLRGG